MQHEWRTLRNEARVAYFTGAGLDIIIEQMPFSEPAKTVRSDSATCVRTVAPRCQTTRPRRRPCHELRVGAQLEVQQHSPRGPLPCGRRGAKLTNLHRLDMSARECERTVYALTWGSTPRWRQSAPLRSRDPLCAGRSVTKTRATCQQFGRPLRRVARFSRKFQAFCLFRSNPRSGADALARGQKAVARRAAMAGSRSSHLTSSHPCLQIIIVIRGRAAQGCR